MTEDFPKEDSVNSFSEPASLSEFSGPWKDSTAQSKDPFTCAESDENDDLAIPTTVVAAEAGMSESFVASVHLEEEDEEFQQLLKLETTRSGISNVTDTTEATTPPQEAKQKVERRGTILALPVTSSTKDADLEFGGQSQRNLVGVTDKRAEFVSVTFYKETPETDIGIQLSESTTSEVNGDNSPQKILISSITPQSLACVSPLRAGDLIFSINNQVCSESQHAMDLASIHQTIKEAVGHITIVVHNIGGDATLVESMVMKSHPDEMVGYSWKTKRNNNGGKDFLVTRIRKNTVASYALINPGDIVLTLNGYPSDQLRNTFLASKIVRQYPSTTIVAKRSKNNGVVTAEISGRHLMNSSVRVLSDPSHDEVMAMSEKYYADCCVLL